MSNPKDVVKQVRKYTRKKFSPDEKIRIVLKGLRGDTPINDLCRREGIGSAVYYKWSKEFLEAGKNGLTRASLHNATTDEVQTLKHENSDLKRVVAELTLEFMKYKKSFGM